MVKIIPELTVDSVVVLPIVICRTACCSFIKECRWCVVGSLLVEEYLHRFKGCSLFVCMFTYHDIHECISELQYSELFKTPL